LMSESGNAVPSDDLLFVDSLHDGSCTSQGTKKRAIARCEALDVRYMPNGCPLLAAQC